MNETSYSLNGNFYENMMTVNLLLSFRQSMALYHKLPEFVAGMRGMSGRKYRYFINNFVGNSKNSRYLEIGSWGGSTACAAIFGNAITAVCIDNWSEFGGPKDVFLNNINAVRNEQVRFHHIERDFRKVDYSVVGKFDIFCFDGPHAEEDHFDGICGAMPALDDNFLLVVDDWNWSNVRKGTLRGMTVSGVSSLASIEVRTMQGDDDEGKLLDCIQEKSEWHNGYFLSVCRKINH